MLPSAERASWVLAGSLKYSNGLAVLNHTVPAVPFGQGFMLSSMMWRSPSSTRPTVPRCASDCSELQEVKPGPSVTPQYSWMNGQHNLIISYLTSAGQGAAACIA